MPDGKAKRLWALPNAELTVPRSLLMHGGSNDLVTVPCPAYLIEHPKGLVLFDTGCHPDVAVDPVGYWGPFAQALQVSYPKEMLLDRQIQGLGYKMSDIKYVVVSHLHLDHTGYMHAFPQARFLIMANELRYGYWPDADRRGAFILNDILPTRNFNWIELDSDFDLFDDGSLCMLKTPGHTPGESSLYVRLPNRKICWSAIRFTCVRSSIPEPACRWIPIRRKPLSRSSGAKRFVTCTRLRSGSPMIPKIGSSCLMRRPPSNSKEKHHATLRISLPVV